MVRLIVLEYRRVCWQVVFQSTCTWNTRYRKNPEASAKKSGDRHGGLTTSTIRSQASAYRCDVYIDTYVHALIGQWIQFRCTRLHFIGATQRTPLPSAKTFFSPRRHLSSRTDHLLEHEAPLILSSPSMPSPMQQEAPIEGTQSVSSVRSWV